ncbi:cytochrome P450 [Ramlibacter algicola]|uniref:Cytochrome P450 n=1 Tax=Ramlibacter algicola TaxID=2795217 RepID=A0A934PZH7_9BURK|nr:cytochrome P450 [Ramlibacter algicola]MBK0392400.1 cytochrome P450 [Ramlibacter algicola]
MHTAAAAAPEARTLDDLPGPRPMPWLGNALQIQRERFHQQLEGWAGEFGTPYVVRIDARKLMVVADPEVIQGVLRARPDGFRRNERVETASRELGFLGLFSANGDTWRRQRPMVLAGLDPTHIRQFFPALLDVTQRLQRRWERAADSGTPVDLQADLMRFTVDVTTALAFGQDLRTLEADGDDTIQKHLNVVLPSLIRRILSPVEPPAWLRRWRERSLRPHLQVLGDAVNGFIASTRAQLQADPSLREHPQNLIQAMVAARDREGSGVTDADVAGNVFTMLLAGEDTTANTLAWMVWLLHRHPQAAQRARAEIDEVLGGAGTLSSIDQLHRLDVVEACAHETMRLKPVAPFVIAQALHDTLVAGVHVPRGAAVVCLMRPGGMNAGLFPQPETFDPQRWLDAKEAGHSFASAKRATMPFGAGPRMCPGRYLALAEIKLAAAMLLANFEVESVEPLRGRDPREVFAFVMAPERLRMRLRRRSTARAAAA